MMMHKSGCKCPHHAFGMVFMVLTGLAMLGFWIATLMHGSLFGISEMHYLKEVIVLAIGVMLTTGKACKCCCGGCGMCADKNMGEGMNKPM